jgi:hypothetical protein
LSEGRAHDTAIWLSGRHVSSGNGNGPETLLWPSLLFTQARASREILGDPYTGGPMPHAVPDTGLPGQPTEVRVEVTMAAGLLTNLARVVGFGAACATIALYVWALGMLAVASLFLFAIMLALGAAWASVMVRPFLLIAISIASFIPSAISFAFTAVYVMLFYVCNVLYLVAAGLMLIAIGLRSISGGSRDSNA